MLRNLLNVFPGLTGVLLAAWAFAAIRCPEINEHFYMNLEDSQATAIERMGPPDEEDSGTGTLTWREFEILGRLELEAVFAPDGYPLTIVLRRYIGVSWVSISFTMEELSRRCP